MIKRTKKLSLIIIFMLMVVFVFKDNIFAAPVEISSSQTISANQTAGIKITGSDVTLTINAGTSGITIGDSSNPNAGIEVPANKKLTIVTSGSGDINILGGTYTDANNCTINYAGINVKANATLQINGGGTATIKATGCGGAHGTGAGIGGNGLYLVSGSTVSNNNIVQDTNAGTIKITGGKVEATGGSATVTSYALGAGIGGGALYNAKITSLTGQTYCGLSNFEITGGKVTAKGGYVTGSSKNAYGSGAGIGGGGIYNSTSTSLVGGVVGDVKIDNTGEVEAIGGTTEGLGYGLGAGIGGGAIYDKKATTLTGSNIERIKIYNSGKATATGGYGTSKKVYGTGAGIGGGGIYHTTVAS